jgi:hypothetical protein
MIIHEDVSIIYVCHLTNRIEDLGEGQFIRMGVIQLMMTQMNVKGGT